MPKYEVQVQAPGAAAAGQAMGSIGAAAQQSTAKLTGLSAVMEQFGAKAVGQMRRGETAAHLMGRALGNVAIGIASGAIIAGLAKAKGWWDDIKAATEDANKEAQKYGMTIEGWGSKTDLWLQKLGLAFDAMSLATSAADPTEVLRGRAKRAGERSGEEKLRYEYERGADGLTGKERDDQAEAKNKATDEWFKARAAESEQLRKRNQEWAEYGRDTEKRIKDAAEEEAAKFFRDLDEAADTVRERAARAEEQAAEALDKFFGPLDDLADKVRQGAEETRRKWKDAQEAQREAAAEAARRQRVDANRAARQQQREEERIRRRANAALERQRRGQPITEQGQAAIDYMRARRTERRGRVRAGLDDFFGDLDRQSKTMTVNPMHATEKLLGEILTATKAIGFRG